MSDDADPRIPHLRPSEAEVTVEPEPPMVGAVPAPGPVLVVDDDDLVRWGTARKLRRAGYEVLEAAGADEALICMQEHGASVSLMLSDVIMPKQTGYELCQEVRRRWPQAQVLLVSGYTPVAMDRHGIQTQGLRVLRKPVADLLEIVTRLIGPPEPV
jgi:two-component system, cell cycle sensor histidine kinase and response regulator CckA